MNYTHTHARGVARRNAECRHRQAYDVYKLYVETTRSPEIWLTFGKFTPDVIFGKEVVERQLQRAESQQLVEFSRVNRRLRK